MIWSNNENIALKTGVEPDKKFFNTDGQLVRALDQDWALLASWSDQARYERMLEEVEEQIKENYISEIDFTKETE